MSKKAPGVPKYCSTMDAAIQDCAAGSILEEKKNCIHLRKQIYTQIKINAPQIPLQPWPEFLLP